MAATPESTGIQPESRARSRLGTIAVTLTALSAVALVVLIVGDLLDWKGFSSNENDNSTFADIVWTTFALGAILALIIGIVAWVRGRRTAWAGDVRAGQLAIGWFVLAVVITLIASALD